MAWQGASCSPSHLPPADKNRAAEASGPCSCQSECEGATSCKGQDHWSHKRQGHWILNGQDHMGRPLTILNLSWEGG